MVKTRICVLGAGVIGLASAHCIQEMLETELNFSPEDYSMTVVAEKFSPHTTSDVAAGFFEPYVDLVSKHDLKTLSKWSKKTWNFFTRLWRTSEAANAGLQMINGYVLTDPGSPEPDWKDTVLNFHDMTPEELAVFPGYKSGFGFTSFMCEQTMYLPYLTGRLRQKGVRFVKKRVNVISELCEEYDVIVNCTGPGAGQLMDDHHVTPIRGQVLRVKAPWVKMFVMDGTGSEEAVFPGGYILPNTNFCVLGGSHGVGDWSLEPNEKITQNILQMCSKLIPGVEKSEIMGVHVGLRPGRNNVRLETESVSDSRGNKSLVVHNYGHGGIGVTLHMGCGLDAAHLARSCILHLRNKAKL